MASTVVTVDDSDSRITYSDGWINAGSSQEYSSTTHGARLAGQTAKFTFRGASIEVFGTISKGGASKKSPVLSTYSIDGSDAVIFTAIPDRSIQYRQLFFRSATLAEGEHTLVITITAAGRSFEFWLDFLEITQSSNPTMATEHPGGPTKPTTYPSGPTPEMPSSLSVLPSIPIATSTGNDTTTSPSTTTPGGLDPEHPPTQPNNIVIDDHDYRVEYSGDWLTAGGSEENDATAHGTRHTGATATLTFTGSGISVFGTIAGLDASPNAPVSTYSIDGSLSGTFTPTENTTSYKQLYFQSPTLIDGQHTLVVTSTVNDSLFWLDYFQVTPAPGTSNTSSIHSGSNTWTGAHTDAPTPVPSDPSTNPPSTSSGTSGPPSGAIAGGVIGGILFILLLAFLLRRWQKSAALSKRDLRWNKELFVAPRHNDSSYGYSYGAEPKV